MALQRKFNTATTIYFPVILAGAADFDTSDVFADSDIQFSVDGGVFVATGTKQPTHEGGGVYSLPIAAAEVNGKDTVIRIVDQTATKVFEDQLVLVETYGNTDAQHAFDLDSVAPDVNIASVDANSIDIAALAADLDTYQAKVWVIDDDGGSTDRYIIAWFKNAQPITTTPSDLTNSFQVFKVDGSKLITDGDPTIISGTKYETITEGTNRMVDGVVYIVQVTASIDSATRTWAQPIGRDSA